MWRIKDNEMNGIHSKGKKNMKTTIYLLALGAAFAISSNVRAGEDSCCAGKAAALSPRAQLNQTAVVCGKSEAGISRADLGTGARAKAGGLRSVASASTKSGDVVVRANNDLGFGARLKATSETGSPAPVQVAPLK